MSDPNPDNIWMEHGEEVENDRRDQLLSLLAWVTGGIHQKAQRPTSGQSPPRSQYFDLSAGPPPFLGRNILTGGGANAKLLPGPQMPIR